MANSKTASNQKSSMLTLSKDILLNPSLSWSEKGMLCELRVENEQENERCSYFSVNMS
jgi:hypothetical protein